MDRSSAVWRAAGMILKVAFRTAYEPFEKLVYRKKQVTGAVFAWLVLRCRGFYLRFYVQPFLNLISPYGNVILGRNKGCVGFKAG